MISHFEWQAANARTPGNLSFSRLQARFQADPIAFYLYCSLHGIERGSDATSYQQAVIQLYSDQEPRCPKNFWMDPTLWPVSSSQSFSSYVSKDLLASLEQEVDGILGQQSFLRPVILSLSQVTQVLQSDDVFAPDSFYASQNKSFFQERSDLSIWIDHGYHQTLEKAFESVPRLDAQRLQELLAYASPQGCYPIIAALLNKMPLQEPKNPELLSLALHSLEPAVIELFLFRGWLPSKDDHLWALSRGAESVSNLLLKYSDGSIRQALRGDVLLQGSASSLAILSSDPRPAANLRS